MSGKCCLWTRSRRCARRNPRPREKYADDLSEVQAIGSAELSLTTIWRALP
jgi:hypothetical protein